MPPDTPAGAPGRFPATRRSVLLAARDADPEVRRAAFGALVESYWRPVYKYLRAPGRLGAEDAQDLSQAFFAQALEKGTFGRYEPDKARFRTFLRLCLDGFVANERKAAGRLKRGGGSVLLPLDFAGAEEELARQFAHPGASETLGPEEYFHREWVRSLFARAVETLRQRCEASGRGLRFALFERYDLEGEGGGRPTYAALAAEHGVTPEKVTNELSAARRELRAIVLETLRELTGSEAELRAEAREILGIDLP
jgi:RNA polymerase sigma factor (sigma-70 family)